MNKFISIGMYDLHLMYKNMYVKDRALYTTNYCRMV